MVCPHCGKEPPADAVFCNYCGKSLGKENSSIAQPTAGLMERHSLTEQPDVSLQTPTAGLPWQYALMEKPGEASQEPPLEWNRLQKYLVRTFDAALAGNALFGALLGSVVAIVGGVLASWLIITVTHLNAAQLSNSANSGDIIDYVLGIVPLQAPLKNGLQLFLVMHGVGAGITITGGTYLYTMPIDGLLALPAVLLTLGGYIAACTDLQNRERSSLLRGGAIAIPYTFLLFIIATQLNGSVSVSQAASASGILNMDTKTLVIFGLLWGVFFGVLGASLKLARGQWRHMLRRYVQTGSYGQLKGMIVGGLSAGGLGFSLVLLWFWCALPYLPGNFFYQGEGCGGGPWQIRLLWNIGQGPWYAVNLFFLSLGAPLTAHLSGPNNFISCFATSSARHVLAITDGSLHLPVWMYVSLLLLPAVSLFLGGRVSAALTNARLKGVGPRMVQGAGIALPFTALMMLCTPLGTETDVYVAPAPTGVAGTTTPISIGVGAMDLLLWALLWAVVLGALGGVYQGSALQRTVQRFLLGLAQPVAWLAGPLFILLDRLSGVRRPATRSHARSLLYGALFASLLLVIVSAVAGVALIIWDKTFSFSTNLGVTNALSCVLIALPGLLLLCSCASALGYDPFAQAQE